MLCKVQIMSGLTVQFSGHLSVSVLHRFIADITGGCTSVEAPSVSDYFDVNIKVSTLVITTSISRCFIKNGIRLFLPFM